MIKEILQNIKDELTNNIKELGYYTENLEVVLEIPKDKEKSCIFQQMCDTLLTNEAHTLLRIIFYIFYSVTHG